MRDAEEWCKQTDVTGRPWLIVGDGPTLKQIAGFNVRSYNVLALEPGLPLNVPVKAGWIADGKTARTLTSEQASRAETWIAPLSLGKSIQQENPTIAALNAQNRLVGYDGSHDNDNHAAQAMRFLADLGSREIRTIGVDFGPGTTPEAVVDADAIAAVIQQYKLTAGPITSEVPARIFIGSDPSQALGAKILEFSIRKHATLTTVFDTMQHVPVPHPKDPENQPRTQFSFSRFVIPELAGYKGRALYLDADMLVFSDLRELWEMPFDDATAMYALPEDPSRPKQTSVMLLNCDRLKWNISDIVADLNAGKYNYEGLMRDMLLEPDGAVQPKVPYTWNSLEIYKPGVTRLLHYTDMKYQPWVDRRNPYADLWISTLREALASGFVTQAEVEQAVHDGYVRPSLLLELKAGPGAGPLVRKTAGPLADARYKPHNALRSRLKKVGM